MSDWMENYHSQLNFSSALAEEIQALLDSLKIEREEAIHDGVLYIKAKYNGEECKILIEIN